MSLISFEQYIPHVCGSGEAEGTKRVVCVDVGCLWRQLRI